MQFLSFFYFIKPFTDTEIIALNTNKSADTPANEFRLPWEYSIGRSEFISLREAKILLSRLVQNHHLSYGVLNLYSIKIENEHFFAKGYFDLTENGNFYVKIFGAGKDFVSGELNEQNNTLDFDIQVKIENGLTLFISFRNSNGVTSSYSFIIFEVLDP